MWGWATWARAWQHYDKAMTKWPEQRAAHWLDELLDSRKEVRYWTGVFDAVHAGTVDTWDYQWIFASWMSAMMTIVPKVNLVSNIGYRSDATHTVHKSLWSDLGVGEMEFPLIHPNAVARDKRADELTNDLMFAKSPWNRVKNRLTRYFG